MGVRSKVRVVVVGESDEHPGQGVGDLLRSESGVFHGFPRGLQQHPVLRVAGQRFPVADAEELGVEARRVVQERGPLRNRPARHARFGVVVLVHVPALGGNLAHEVVAAQQRFPQLFRGFDPAGKPAGHADDGDRSRRDLTV